MDKNSLAHTRWECKYHNGNRRFLCRGYYVDTVGKNAKKIEEYIRNKRSAEGALFIASLEASREQRLIAAEETTG